MHAWRCAALHADVDVDAQGMAPTVMADVGGRRSGHHNVLNKQALEGRLGVSVAACACWRAGGQAEG